VYQVDLTDYEKSGTWDVVDVPGEFKTEYDDKEGQMVSRAEYTIVMRRKTLFYTVNLILPCILISMLSMVVFYLPTTAGEKITMSVSIFLALIVFLQVRVGHGLNSFMDWIGWFGLDWVDNFEKKEGDWIGLGWKSLTTLDQCSNRYNLSYLRNRR